MNKKLVFGMVIEIMVLITLTFLVFKIQKPPNELLIQKMKSSIIPVNNILIQIDESENSNDTLIFYLTNNKSLYCGYYKKTIFGYKHIDTIGGVATTLIEDESKNFAISMINENPAKHIVIGALNYNSEISSINYHKESAVLVEKNGYRFWYMYLEEITEFEGLEFN